MSFTYPKLHMVGGASAEQKGRAAEMRYSSSQISTADKTTLHQIVHSADKVGKFAAAPNPYRDTTSSYDAKAEAALKSIAKKY